MNPLLILEAIVAIPKTLKELRGIGQDISASIDRLRNSLTTQNLGELKTEVTKTLKKLDKAETDAELKKLLADLSNALNQ